ncbi:MAG: hypothetical protein IPP66_01045 [Anaerolineales bacterium]|nr:hypothetical protein [Anaerolineales bacterium]
MKNAAAGASSGCIIWVVIFCIMATCVIPIAATAGGISSGSDLAVRTVGPMVCPENTTPKIDTYSTTSIDDNGFERPATGYQIQCFDTNGEVVKTDPVAFAFIWIGIFAGIGLVLAGILAFVFAAPGGVLIAKLLNRNKQHPDNMY